MATEAVNRVAQFGTYRAQRIARREGTAGFRATTDSPVHQSPARGNPLSDPERRATATGAGPADRPSL